MLDKIPWSEFIWFLVLFLVPYYLFVLVLYFRNEILALGRSHQHNRHTFSKPDATPVVQTDQSSQREPDSNSSETPFTLVHELLEDLKTLFNQASRSNMVKEELVQAIYSKLKAYPEISGTDLREDIDHHIYMEVKQVCGIDLEPQDLLRIWPD